MPHSMLFRALLGILASAAVAGTALAGSGDLYKVTGERVNLRAGPTDQAAVRAQILQGEELIELAQQGRWLGVRVARTGRKAGFTATSCGGWRRARSAGVCRRPVSASTRATSTA
jgi:uncharacterized protein YgiM (DUF1202 family)